MTTTYLDTSVLIAAATKGKYGELAGKLLAEETRTFVSSPFLEIEVLPKAGLYGKDQEKRLYAVYFELAKSVKSVGQIVSLAMEEAMKYGISAMDAFHVAAAHIGGCDELLTLEESSKPMFRTKLVRVRSLPEIRI